MDHAAADGRDDAPLILIVDDGRDIADMLESYFRLEGYRTIVAHDAAGALAAAPSRAPPSPSGRSQRAGAVTSASGSTSPVCSPRSTAEGSRWPTVRAAARSRARRSPPHWLKAARSQTEAAT